MAYIISVNASILSDSGGPCVCPASSTDSCATDADYTLCVNDVRRDLITASAAAAALASFLMGAFANIPVGLAPGLGLNAYFAYSIVGYHGTGSTTYGEALAAVFLEGYVFPFIPLVKTKLLNLFYFISPPISTFLPSQCAYLKKRPTICYMHIHLSIPTRKTYYSGGFSTLSRYKSVDHFQKMSVTY